MRKFAIVFVAAVFLPSLLLAALALRSLRDQRIVFEQQQTLLYQGVADAISKTIQDQLAAEHQEFGRAVEKLLAGADSRNVATKFDEKIVTAWPAADVGFAVALPGDLLAPLPAGRLAAQRFRTENELFLTNRRAADVFLPQQSKMALGKTGTQLELGQPQQQAAEPDLSSNSTRNVAPMKNDLAQNNFSKLSAAPAEFRQLIGDENNSGIVARFLQNKLNLLFWYRSPVARQFVFGAQVNLDRLVENLRPLILVDASLGQKIGAALLDDAGKPVAVSRSLPNANWKHPFVATEVGEVLPHWELAIYLVDPAQFAASARTLSTVLALAIATLLIAIVAGGWLIVTDLRRQLTLAQQKTDFVSNVSHELKTPLTSIRMFSELLADGRAIEEEKRRHYLHIIASESERLTRLINNVLDFARSERGELKLTFSDVDLGAFVAGFIGEQRPRLEADGWKLQLELPDPASTVRADRDALAQVMLNLISNAEKYASSGREISVVVSSANGSATIRVRDRGPGVSRGAEAKIFDQFYRAHDSLSSGIQGSGLGLTLSRRIARAHGGELLYEPRPDGGSCFVFTLPATNS
jgi:signal transduction histidine kinase